MPAGPSLVFLGVALAAASFGGGAVLRRLGESGPSCALSATAGALALVYGTLAVLPRPPFTLAAMLPLLAITAALGVGWITDTASTRLPHTTANTTLAVVSIASLAGWLQVSTDAPSLPTGVITMTMAIPTVAGIVFAPPTTRTVIWWYSLGIASVLGCVSVAFLHPGASSAEALGISAAFAVGLAVLIAGRILVQVGQAGAGDPVWLASSALAASSHAVLSAGTPTAPEAVMVATMGASIFFVVGGLIALLINAAHRANAWFRSKRSLDAPTKEALQITLAGQWSALGMMGFVIIWKFTPLGTNMTTTWISPI